VGFEVLYWIPMLRWFCSEFDIRPDRLVVLSRGGPRSWYGGLTDRYVELLDLISVDELRAIHEDRIRELGGQKQLALTRAESELLERARGHLGTEDCAFLHPRAMYGLFRWYWSRLRPISVVEHHTHYRPIDPQDIAAPAGLERLPSRYVAMKLYFSSCFPDTAQNRAFISRLLEQVTAHTDVVLLDTGMAIDDHRDYEGQNGSVVSARALMTPANNLEMQTQIISGADALFATYGGFSYLGPFLGVPSIALYDEPNFVAEHLDVMRRASDQLALQEAGAPFIPLRRRDFDQLSAMPGLLPVLGAR
jgi:hypothetical protein